MATRPACLSTPPAPAEGRFSRATLALAMLALFLVSATAADAALHLQPAARLGVTAGMALLMLPLLALPWGTGGLVSRRAVLPHETVFASEEAEEEARQEAGQASKSASCSGAGGSGSGSGSGSGPGLEEPLLPPAAPAGTAEPTADAAGPPAAGPELGPLLCLGSANFWLLFSAVCIGTGTGGWWG